MNPTVGQAFEPDRSAGKPDLRDADKPGRAASPTGGENELSAQVDDPRVTQALEEYLAGLEAGQKPDRQQFQARYPDLADALDECLAGLEFVQAATPELAEPDRDGTLANPAAVEPEGPLGDYRIVREIGRGGMGVVYEAVQISLGRRVALKVLPFAAAMDPKQLQRFKNEAHAAAQLHHTNIVPVFGVGCERGVHYYAMQFIDGQTLAALIRELRQASSLEGSGPSQPSPRLSAVAEDLLSGRVAPAQRPVEDGPPTGPYVPAPDVAALPSAATTPRGAAAVSTDHSIKSAAYFRTVAHLGVQAAEALEHAHELGVVHRDIKPANLLLDVRGNLWITDFGLAHCQSQVGLTMSGDLVGTLRYMSPEQALAKRVLIDHRTDIYSLGVTLYELLTLQHAFAGRDREEVLRQITFEEPRSPRRLNKAIPVELETILLKAMEKNPGARYALAQELADDLQRFLEDKPIKAKRPTLVQWIQKWARRHRPVVAAAAVVCFMALLFAAGTWLWMAQTSAQTVGAAQEALHRAGDLQAKGRWSEALEAAQHAESLLQLAVGRPDLKQSAQATVSDMKMLQELEKIRLDEIGVKDDHFDTSPADARYARAFREYGIDVENLEASEAGERIRARPINLELAAALDHWALFVEKPDEGPTEAKAKRTRLLAIAAAADPDSWRNQFRDLFQRAPYKRKILEELAASADIAALPAPTLCLLGGNLLSAGRVNTAISVLRQAQQRFPEDFWVNVYLGAGYARAEPAQPGETLRFQTVAVAIHPQSAGVHQNLGLALANVGNLSDAVIEYQKAILLKPDYAAAHQSLGQALVRLNKYAEAVAACREGIRFHPQSPQMHQNLALALCTLGKFGEALTEFRQATLLKPDFPVSHYFVGICLQKLGKSAEAVAEFREAIRLKPDETGAHGDLAQTLAMMGRADEARAEYQEAIRLRRAALARIAQPQRSHAASAAATRLQEGLAEAYCNLADVLSSQGKIGEADNELREAIRISPAYMRAHSSLGMLLCDKKHDYEGAIAAFKAAIQIAPNEGWHYMNLGNAFRGRQAWDEAIAAYQQAIRLKPDEARIRYNLALALEKKGALDEAIAAFRETIRLKRDWPGVHCNLGNALAAKGAVEEASAAYKEAIRLQPDYAIAYNNYASLLATCRQSSLRDPAQAVELAKRATELAPKEGDCWNTLGVASYRAGAWQAATTALERSMTLRKGGDAYDWLFLAMAHWQLGHREEARQWYHRAVVWIAQNQRQDEELSRFRAEAWALLERQGPEAPKDQETSPRKR